MATVFVIFQITLWVLVHYLFWRARLKGHYLFWAAAERGRARDVASRSPVKARILGIGLLSVAAAAIGVWIYPHFLQSDPAGRIATLIALPLFLGWFLDGGKIQWERKGKNPLLVRSSTFFTGLAFLNLVVRYGLITALNP